MLFHDDLLLNCFLYGLMHAHDRERHCYLCRGVLWLADYGSLTLNHSFNGCVRKFREWRHTIQSHDVIGDARDTLLCNGRLYHVTPAMKSPLFFSKKHLSPRKKNIKTNS